MDNEELDKLVTRAGRTQEEWEDLTPEERLQAAMAAQKALEEAVPPELREQVREMYRERLRDA